MNKTSKSLIIGGVIVSLLLGIILNQSSPDTAGPVGILLVFGLLYTLSLAVTTLVIYALNWLLRRVGKLLAFRKPVESLSLTKAYYYGSVLALLPVILIGMQSVGGVGIYDLFLVVIFGVIGCLYIAKKTA